VFCCGGVPVVQMNTKEGRVVQDATQVFDGIPRSGVSFQVLVGTIHVSLPIVTRSSESSILKQIVMA
jgi:hypothetical protein